MRLLLIGDNAASYAPPGSEDAIRNPPRTGLTIPPIPTSCAAASAARCPSTAGLAIGGMMGIYQMLKGAHYLSHTVISALLCWIVFLLIRRCFRLHAHI